MSTSTEAEPPADTTSPTVSPHQSTHENADRERGGTAHAEQHVNEKNEEDKYAVTTLDEADDPKARALLRKWVSVVVIGSASMCAACASSIHSFAETGVEGTFHVSEEVSILGISLFVMGLGTAPLLVGPLSEVYGRRPIYTASYSIFFALSFPVAFAPDMAVFLIFRFFTGMCGAAFLSVAGGSISDLFTNETVATPMAFYTITPFLGPVIGPLVSGFINQNTNWRWTYYVMCIWIFVETVLLVLFVPETFTPVLLKRKAERLRKETGDDRYRAPMEKQDKSLLRSLLVSCYKPFQLLIYERMVLLIDIWNALILGILYLAFQAFPIIFRKHNYTEEQIGLSFLGLGLGILIGLAIQPYWNRMFARVTKENNGVLPPETRLIPGMFGAVLAPLSLIWLAFTTYKSVNSAVPIIASVPFGTATVQIFTSSFTYLVVNYRPWAASAMASNSFVRSCFAAGFPLFAGAMYQTLGTVGATALLAGCCALMAPLPFIFYRIGPRLRAKSRFSDAGMKQ